MNEKKAKKLVSKIAGIERKMGKLQLTLIGLNQELDLALGRNTSASSIKPAVKEVKTGDKRAARGSVAAAINKCIEAGKKFSADDVEKSITSAGDSVSKGSISTALGKFVKDKKLKREDRGVYVKA